MRSQVHTASLTSRALPRPPKKRLKSPQNPQRTPRQRATAPPKLSRYGGPSPLCSQSLTRSPAPAPGTRAARPRTGCSRPPLALTTQVTIGQTFPNERLGPNSQSHKARRSLPPSRSLRGARRPSRAPAAPAHLQIGDSPDH